MDFERELAHHKDSVYRQLFRMCGNHEDAEDVLAEAMVSAFRSIGSLQDEKAFRAWMVQIGRRACGRLRARPSGPATLALEQLEDLGIEAAGSENSPEQQAVEGEFKSCLARVLSNLPASYRDVYRMAAIEGHSMKDISAALDLPVPTVKTRLHRARAMVREAVDREIDCA